MAGQLGFWFDTNRCVQCHACEVACKSLHGVEVGPRWRRVLDRWAGTFPKVANTSLSVSCFHCATPACLAACPASAIRKSPETGVVSVEREACIGCRSCAAACPFGAPQFGHDGRMQKCGLCQDRVERGLEPGCVATCPGGALAFGDLGDLAARAGSTRAVPLTGDTAPSVRLVPAANAAGIPVDFREFFNRSGGRADAGRPRQEQAR